MALPGVDPGIAPLVDALAERGWTTLGSCEGHSWGRAWVTVAGGPFEMAKLAADVQDIGYRYFVVSARNEHSGALVPQRCLVLEFWGRIAAPGSEPEPDFHSGINILLGPWKHQT